jgi:hypothetical protein
MKNISLNLLVISTFLTLIGNANAQNWEQIISIDKDLKLSENTHLFYGNSQIHIDNAYKWQKNWVILDKKKKRISFLNSQNQVYKEFSISVQHKEYPIFSSYGDTLQLNNFKEPSKSYIFIRKANEDISSLALKPKKILKNTAESIVYTYPNFLVHIGNLYANPQRLKKVVLLQKSSIDTLYKVNLQANESFITVIREGFTPLTAHYSGKSIYVFDSEVPRLTIYNLDTKYLKTISWDKKDYPALQTGYIYFSIDSETNRWYLVSYKNHQLFVAYIKEDSSLDIQQAEVVGKFLTINNNRLYILAKNHENKKYIYEQLLK